MKKILLTALLSITLISSSNSYVVISYKSEEISTPGSRFSENQINNAIDNGDSTDAAISPNIDPVWPSTPDYSDKTTSFDDAAEISFEGSCGEYFQSTDDHDYYVYYAEYTNYFRFNIEYLNSSYYDCNINIYKNSNFTTPIYSYLNTDTKTGCNIDSIEPIYAYQGEVYYFEIYQEIPQIQGPITTIQTFYAGYTAKIISANETDCDPSEYDSKGYVLSRNFIYNGSDNIFCYFDDQLDTYVTSSYSYKDAVKEAISIWNSVGIKQFVETSSETSPDIVFYITYNDAENFVGRTTLIDYDKNNVYKGEVKFNSYYLENDYNRFSKTYHEQLLLNVALHEIGHCLGINDFESEGNIMYGTNTTLCNLGQWDIALYRYLWG